MRFKDRTIIVTGGAQGIGKAIAKAFAKEGGTIVIFDKSAEESQNTVKEIISDGGRAVATTGDATQGEQVRNAVEQVAKEHGRIDILINNIGLTVVKTFLETNEIDWKRELDVNLLVLLRFCHAVLPYMVKQQYGRIVNISSTAGRQARPQAVIYGAAKAGVIAVTRSLAVAMAPHNIRVNCVCPGGIETPSFQKVYRDKPQYIQTIIENVAMAKTGQPEEIATVVLFLASDESSYMTGQSVSVDGGNVML